MKRGLKYVRARQTYLQANTGFISYAPQGAVASWTDGSGGSYQVAETYDYNNRLQLVRMRLAGNGAIACAVYNYYAGVANPSTCAIPSQATSGDDGNVIGRYDQDDVNTSLSHTAAYQYDAMHRLVAAAATGNSTYNLTYSYDQYGNMTCTQNRQTQGLCPQYGFNTSTNQINNSGYSYDAAGDLTNDSSHSYQYDAEGRLVSVDSGSTATYVYNALGERVEKDVAGAYTEYVFGKDRKPLGQYNRTAWVDSWVTFRGRHVVHFEGGSTLFIHADQIGTTNIVTDWATGTVVQDELHYPWGQVWTSVGTIQEERFAGMHHRDSESNLDPTQFRMFASDTGRWMSPDPASRWSANPYSPQSWNRYGYVQGNPLNYTDPFGLCGPWWMSGACQMFNYVNQVGQNINASLSGAVDYLVGAAQSSWNTITTYYSYAGPSMTLAFGLIGMGAAVSQPELAVGGMATGALGVTSGILSMPGINRPVPAPVAFAGDAVDFADSVSNGDEIGAMEALGDTLVDSLTYLPFLC